MEQVLHSPKVNKNAYKALVAAQYVGVKVETTSDFQMGVSNKSPEFLKLNPIGKVLVFGHIHVFLDALVGTRSSDLQDGGFPCEGKLVD